MKKMILVLALTLTAIPAFSYQCDIEPIKGKYGVRQLRASGWVFLTQGQSYQDAENSLVDLRAGEQCD